MGSMKWELLHPINSDEVAKALSRMKDGAPGPEGRKLKDVRTLPPDQLAAHFNLWLLAGYLPSVLLLCFPSVQNWVPRRSSVDHDIRYRGQVLPPDFGTEDGGEPFIQCLGESV